MPRTRPTRHRERADPERAALDALLDTTHIGHFAFIDGDAGPRVMPTAVVRHGDVVLAHGSSGSPWMRLLADGLPTCLAVTAFDGLVVARSAFESSIHYRSAVLFGRCAEIAGAAKIAALDAVTDALLPGRIAEVRRPTDREIAATLVVALPITEWSLKVSTGWPADSAEDVAGEAWAGVLARATSYGEPIPAPDLRPGIEVPESVRGLIRSSSARCRCAEDAS